MQNAKCKVKGDRFGRLFLYPSVTALPCHLTLSGEGKFFLQRVGDALCGVPESVTVKYMFQGTHTGASLRVLFYFHRFNRTVTAVNGFLVYGFEGSYANIIFLATLELFKGGFCCFAFFDGYFLSGFLGEFL